MSTILFDSRKVTSRELEIELSKNFKNQVKLYW